MLPASKMMEKYWAPVLAGMLVLCPSACSMIGSCEPLKNLLPERGMSRAIRASSRTCAQQQTFRLLGKDLEGTITWQGCQQQVGQHGAYRHSHHCEYTSVPAAKEASWTLSWSDVARTFSWR